MGAVGEIRIATRLAAVAVGVAIAGPLVSQARAQAPTIPSNDLQGALAVTGAQTPAPAPVQHAEPPLAPVPEARCGPGSRPLAGEQGRVPAAAVTSPEAARGWTCNTELVGRDPSLPGGFRTWRYVDNHAHVCAFYDTSLVSTLNVASAGGGPSPGVAVLDMSDPAHPQRSDLLVSPPMLAPHESLNLNQRRGLLAAEMGNGSSLPGLMAIYDVSQDCRHPTLDATYAAAPFGHESGFALDGRTFWVGGGEGIAAVDVSDPRNPTTIWKGNEYAHGLNLSDDGNTLYDTDPIDGGITFLDVSPIQARSVMPSAREISRLTWTSTSVPQNSIPVTIGGRPLLIEFDEFAFRFNPPTSDDMAGAGRIIDLADPAHPRVISNLRLTVNMQAEHRAASADPNALGGPALGYGAHYCAVPREREPGIVACSFLNSGLRVFDIRDPVHPREAAYYISPPAKSTEPDQLSADLAFSQPAFDPARHEVWYTDGSTGFYALRLINDAWPGPRPPVASAGRRRTCLSRRTVLVHLHLRGAGALRSARVLVGGRLRRGRVVGRSGVLVDLRRRPRGAFTVRVVARTISGATRRTIRRYRTCARRHQRQRRPPHG